MAKYTVLDTQTGKMVTFDWSGNDQPTDADMENVFSEARSMTPQKTETQNMQIDQQPKRSRMQQAAAAISPYARTALEMGGMLAGGAIAAPVAPPVGALGGAGLGYAAGRQLANALETYAGQRPQTTTGQNLVEAARDIPMGATMEAGGAVLGLPVQKGLQTMGRIAPRLYESVAKIPPRSIPKVTREKAVKTALENEIPATQKGYQKLRGMIEDTNENIAREINEAEELSRNARARNAKSGISGEYDETMINVNDILKRLDKVKQWAKTSYPDPTPVNKAIDEFKYNIRKTRGPEISIADAQRLKQGIYRRLTDAAYGEYSTPTKEMDKAIARGIKEELLNKLPQLQSLNNRDSALINLQKILEKTVNRTRNWDIAGLSDLAGAGAGTVAGMVESGGDYGKGGLGAATGFMLARGLRSPAVMSQLSFALNKAAKKGISKLGPRAASYGAAQISGMPEINAEEIVGNVLNAFTPSAEAAMVPAPGIPTQQKLTGFLPRDQGTLPQAQDKQQLQLPPEQAQRVPLMRKSELHPNASPAIELERKGTQLALDAWDNMSPAQYDEAIKTFKMAMKQDPNKREKYQVAIKTLQKEKEGIIDLKRRDMWKLSSLDRVSTALNAGI
jgi:tetratricopeptide (TPR) repeat protein